MSLGVLNSAAFLTAAQLAVAANATVEVRRESDSGLASIFSDRAGTAAITNPSAFADSEGRFTFYVAASPGGFSIAVTSGAESFTLNNVPIGLGQEFDIDEYWRAVLATASAAAAQAALGIDLLGTAKHISGLTYANNATDATNDIDIAVGECRDSTDAVNMAIASALVKRLDASWVTGTNQGGLSSSLTIGNNDYYIHVIRVAGVDDIGFDTSPTAANLIADHAATHYRLIGWFKRVGGTIVAFTTYETEGGGIELAWNVPTLDVNLANTLTTSRRTDAVKVPLNFSTLAHLNVALTDASTAFVLTWIGCPDQADAAPSQTAAPLGNLVQQVANSGFGELHIRTSSTGTIAARSTLATVDLYAVSTMGFTWARRN